eukprot:14246-Heterococcus_DN1.PRE.7
MNACFAYMNSTLALNNTEQSSSFTTDSYTQLCMEYVSYKAKLDPFIVACTACQHSNKHKQPHHNKKPQAVGGAQSPLSTSTAAVHEQLNAVD